jgi:hypothetical protein
MTANLSVSIPDRAKEVSLPARRWVKYAFWGGVAGLVVGLAAAFVLAMLDGQARGLSPGSCVAYGCTLTLLLSHLAGLGGMVAGATLGSVAGGVVYWVRHRPRPPNG